MAADPARRQATYEDVLRAPEHMVAEVLDGDLMTARVYEEFTNGQSSQFLMVHRKAFERGLSSPGWTKTNGSSPPL
jgi:hypothetical protein